MKVIKHKDKWYLQSDTGYKEILLSTDTELQKDGVQAIDDDFLEWFVKNQSCEWVEISLEETQYGSEIYEYVIYKREIPKEESKKIFNLPIATNLGNAFTETMKSVSQHEGGIRQGEINLPSFKEEVCICTDECLGYLTKTCKRIEEPKKEPKQRLEKYSERFNNKENEVVDGIFDSENWGRRVVKQETLEEAKVNNLIKLFGKDYDLEPRCVIESCNDSLIYGVEWQQEKCEKDLDAHLDIAKTLWLQVVKENKKMYSEEEVHNILNSYKSFISSGMKIPYFEWFEQFKKK